MMLSSIRSFPLKLRKEFLMGLPSICSPLLSSRNRFFSINNQTDIVQIEDLDGNNTVGGKAAYPHLKGGSEILPTANIDLRLPHSTYTRSELEDQISGHHVPVGFAENAAFLTVSTLRRVFDVLTGYSTGKHTEKSLLRRVMFLETVAGVPGMVGAMNRHLRSLRRIEQDYGWIHTLLEEAENERMHLMTALLIRKPSVLLKAAVAAAQAVFFSWYAVMYSLSPVYCHRFVGYLEEEAFKTYTTIVDHIDKGHLPGFEGIAPTGARRYWGMPDEATLRDVFLAIRADENHHRVVNHTFASMKKMDRNPFPPGF